MVDAIFSGSLNAKVGDTPCGCFQIDLRAVTGRRHRDATVSGTSEQHAILPVRFLLPRKSVGPLPGRELSSFFSGTTGYFPLGSEAGCEKRVGEISVREVVNSAQLGIFPRAVGMAQCRFALLRMPFFRVLPRNQLWSTNRSGTFSHVFALRLFIFVARTSLTGNRVVI